jgi:hypothetical protein
MNRSGREPRVNSIKSLGGKILSKIAFAGIWIGAMNSVTGSSAKAQTMGAWGLSNGSVNIPVTTIGTGKTYYGSQSINIMNQSDRSGSTPPTLTFSMPLLPKATTADQLLSKPKYYQPDLGPFETNR